MEFNNRLNPKVTTTEGKNHWHSRSIAVCAMIVSQDESVLITQRSATMDTHPNKWCLPCGYLDWDESIHQALIREVYEEVGIDISGQDVLMYHINDASKADELQNVTFHFMVAMDKNAADIVLTPSDEVQATCWLTLDEVDADQFMGKKAAFGHFERIKKAIAGIEPMHHTKLDAKETTQFKF